MAIALPAIGRDLGFAPAGLQWVLSAYTLTFGGGLLLAGRVADRYGRRRVFRIGLLLFAAASLACALAPTAAALIAARAIQGAGRRWSPRRRWRCSWPPRRTGCARSAIWTAAAAGGGASGWVLGGLITSGFGWEWVFLVNVPVGVAGAALAGRLLPEGYGTGRGSRCSGRSPDARPRRVLLGLSERLGCSRCSPASSCSRSPPAGRSCRAAALRRRSSAGAWSRSALTATTSAGDVPRAAAGRHGERLVFAPFNVAVDRRFARRAAVPRAMTTGLAAIAAGSAVLALGGPLLVAFLVMGAGLGVASVASTRLGMGGDAQGVASGLLNTAAQLGTAIGLAVLVPPAAALGFGWGWAACGAIALSSSVATLRAAGSSRTCGSASGSAYAPKQTLSRRVKTPIDSAWPSESGIAGSTSTHSAPSR